MLLICQAQNVIAQEICLIHDDTCIHYSVKQDIKCIDCLINAPLKDSIVNTMDGVIVQQTRFIALSDSSMIALNKELTKTEKKYLRMKKKRNTAFVLGGIGALTAFLLTFFISK